MVKVRVEQEKDWAMREKSKFPEERMNFINERNTF